MDRTSTGYNMVPAVGFTHIGTDSPNRSNPTLIDLDPTRPNELYWAYIDSIVQRAWSKDIRIALVPTWGQYIRGRTNTELYINDTTAKAPYWTNMSAVKAGYPVGSVAQDYICTDWSPIYDDLALAYGMVDGERAPTGHDKGWPLMTIHPIHHLVKQISLPIHQFHGGMLEEDGNPSSLRGRWARASQARSDAALDDEAPYEARYENGNKSYLCWQALSNGAGRIASVRAVELDDLFAD
ncbi:hypothetical protein VTK73DRAFT_6165 [Phialemonium thermophilum]|uniref:Apiosidase-like catalytic domain-containing protein n=1 Tax=Phialemonium thermophilum TaxID=223376 RepID=A0ABR3WKT7_9PEZI